MKYCEGSAAAEIVFSLTGGREGRLMSYNPPVEVFFADKATKFYILKTIPLGGGNSANVIFDVLVLERVFPFPKNDGNGNLGIIVHSQNRPYSTRVDFSYAGVYQIDYRNYRPIYNNIGNKYVEATSVLWEDRWYASAASSYEYAGWFIGDNQKENVFCIQDTKGVLYFHEVPKGFTPTWQVTCIGCQQGECAGSDGKGGVVCMDCKQMSNDLQAVKRSLGR